MAKGWCVTLCAVGTLRGIEQNEKAWEIAILLIVRIVISPFL